MSWLVLADSVTGTSHRARDIPGQDAFRFGTLGSTGEWLVVVVADGAGSASHSQMGATLACDEFLRRINVPESEALFTRMGMNALFTEVRAILCTRAQQLDLPLRQLACTTLLAIVGPSGAAFAQIGDGAIVIGGGSELRTVFWTEPTNYANETDFLTDEHFADAIRFETTTDLISELAVFTDGLQRLSLDFAARVPSTAFFCPFFRNLRSVPDSTALEEPFRTFLDSERVNQRTDDDKTLIVAIRRHDPIDTTH